MLILVPTGLELARLTDLGGFGKTALVELCGFGPIAAAARTAQCLERLAPSRVILVGIAGAFDATRDPLGSALEFGTVAVCGVGVGSGAAHLPPPALGFPQWPAGGDPARPAIFDSISLSPLARSDALLLTTPAASASREEADERRSRFPAARAEDMEGFAVALACALTNTPLSIVRGISNEVGDRAREHWSIPRALAAARDATLALLERPS